MNFGLHGRVAIVTGGARGIGFEHCRILGSEGVKIAIVDIDPEKCQQATKILTGQGIEAIGLVGDASEENFTGTAMTEIKDKYGKIEILINNAGIGVKPEYYSENMPVDNWDEMIKVHLRSTFLWSKSFINEAKGGGFGRIINTSSMNFTGGGRPGVTHYSAAKAGIIGFTQTLAKEVGKYGVTVNAIAPGYVETELISQFDKEKLKILVDQNPLGRLCRPSEVAAVVAFLCSSQAAFINGECICIDGGRRDFFWEHS